MKKQTQIKLAAGILLLTSIVLISETGFTGPGSGNRYEKRFKKDAPTDQTPTTQQQSGTNTTNAAVNYGPGNQGCRDAFVLLNTSMDSTSNDSGKSRIEIPPLTHGQIQEFKCTVPKPALRTADGRPVIDSGSIKVQCINGSAALIAANCEGEPKKEDPPTNPNNPNNPPGGTPAPTPTPVKCGNSCTSQVGRITVYREISKNASTTTTVAYVYYCTDTRTYFVNYVNSSSANYCTTKNPSTNSNSK